MGDASNDIGAGAQSAPGGYRASNDGNTVGTCFSSRMSAPASGPANSTPPVLDVACGPAFVAANNEVPTGGDFSPKKRNSANWGLHFRKPELWTDERRELLRREWLARAPGRELLPKLNALPGDPLRLPQVYAYATRVMRLPVRFAAVSNVWTTERDEVIRREYAAGTKLADIYAMLSALPGSPISRPRAIKERARVVGVQRSSEFMEDLIRQNRFRPSVWTAERDSVLREAWPVKAIPTAEIMARLNALPGRQLTERAVQQRAKNIDCPPRPKGRAPLPPEQRAKAKAKPAAAPRKAPPRFVAYAPPAPALEPPPEYDATRATSMEARMEKARAAFRASMNADATQLAARLGLHLRQVLQAKGEVRMERAAA